MCRKNIKQMNIKNIKTGQISTRILYVLVGITVVVFALFYLIGYNMPYMFDPTYNAPLFTDVVLWLLYIMTFLAVSVAVCAVVRGYRRRSRESVVNGIPVARIAWGTLALLVVLLVLTFLIGSSSPVTVNGKTFADVFWLKATDMFIYTILLLLVVAAGAVGYSAMRIKN